MLEHRPLLSRQELVKIQDFNGQNLRKKKFEVPENGLQKSIIYVCVMKKMQKKNPKTLDP